MPVQAQGAQLGQRPGSLGAYRIRQQQPRQKLTVQRYSGNWAVMARHWRCRNAQMAEQFGATQGRFPLPGPGYDA